MTISSENVKQQLTSMLTANLRDDDASVLIVCKQALPDPGTLLRVDMEIQWESDIDLASEIDTRQRADLGVVLDQVEHMTSPEDIHLLAALRDRHCVRVALQINTDKITDRELLALGYTKQRSRPEDGRRYVFDPAIFFERRDWNTPDHWAHPENFDKKRW